MPTFNGHKNWNHWNVSLWINNDEWLYAHAQHMLKMYPKARESAARALLVRLRDDGITHNARRRTV